MVIYASIQIFRGTEPLLSWVGLNLTALSLIPFFIDYRKNGIPANSKQTMVYTMVSGLGLVICMAVSYRYNEAAGIIHIWAGATFIGWVVFVRFCLKR